MMSFCVKAEFQQLSGQKYVTARNKFDVPEELKSQKVLKFTKKYLICHSFVSSENGTQVLEHRELLMQIFMRGNVFKNDFYHF
jgi:hypothetical protein